MAYLANDRQGSKIVVASGEGVAQPPEEQRVVSHDLSVRSPRVRQSLFFVSSHTHTHGKGGDVNPARLPKFNAPLVFGRRVSATARASADAALAPRIRFLLLYFSLDRFYPPRSPIPSCLLVSWRAVLVQPGPGFARSFTSDWLAILSHLSARVLLFLVTVCHVRGDISPSPRFIAKLPLSLSVASLESFFTVR